MAKRAIIPGTDWTPAIVNALTAARLMILVCSDAANKSKHVFRETQFAFESDLKVIPLKIDQTQPSAELRYYLGPVHYLDASKGQFADHLCTLIRSVHT